MDISKIKYFYWENPPEPKYGGYKDIEFEIYTSAHSSLHDGIKATSSIVKSGDLVQVKRGWYTGIVLRTLGNAIAGKTLSEVAIRKQQWVIFMFASEEGVVFFDGRNHGIA